MIAPSAKKQFSLSKLAELLLFPSFCKLCTALLDAPGERVVCRNCLEQLKSRIPSHCLCCGRFFGGVGESHFCQDCLQEKPPFSLHRSCGRYQGKLKNVILLYKYGRFKVLGKELARFAHHTLREEEDLWQGVDVLIPVPLHPKRLKERGFNQAHFVARELARLKRIPCAGGVLVKVRHVLPQTSLKAEERLKNVREAFGVKRKNELAGMSVLLVDDVYTTGATLRECSRVLREACVEDVKALTLAQA